jgi:hypothetical protein
VIEEIKCSNSDQFTFNTNGELEVFGTVEKSGIKDMLLKKDKFEKKPWSATTKATGTGSLTYKVIPAQSLAASKVHYQLSMAMPMPDDVDLDWSKVSEGVLQKAEETIITSVLKHIKPFKGTRVMPLAYSGEVSLFSDSKQPILKILSVDHITTKAAAGGMQVNFVAHAKL